MHDQMLSCPWSDVAAILNRRNMMVLYYRLPGISSNVLSLSNTWYRSYWLWLVRYHGIRIQVQNRSHIWLYTYVQGLDVQAGDRSFELHIAWTGYRYTSKYRLPVGIDYYRSLSDRCTIAHYRFYARRIASLVPGNWELWAYEGK